MLLSVLRKKHANRANDHTCFIQFSTILREKLSKQTS